MCACVCVWKCIHINVCVCVMETKHPSIVEKIMKLNKIIDKKAYVYIHKYEHFIVHEYKQQHNEYIVHIRRKKSKFNSLLSFFVFLQKIVSQRFATITSNNQFTHLTIKRCAARPLIITIALVRISLYLSVSIVPIVIVFQRFAW